MIERYVARGDTVWQGPPMKVVLVLCDGLGDAVARSRMGYLEHLTESGLASRFVSRAALPTASRINYETIDTGLLPHAHGITSNHVVRLSSSPNLFTLASGAGLKTAAVALFFISELYHKSPYDPLVDTEYDDPSSPIQHGRFYLQLDQPDGEVIWGGVALSKRFAPDYLLVHPLGVDHAGHEHARDSTAYRNAVRKQDDYLAVAIPQWQEAGYAVLVIGDHGHNADKDHGGTSDEERYVPLYAIPLTGDGRGDTGETVDHTQIAPTICGLLGLDTPDTMTAAPIELWTR